MRYTLNCTRVGGTDTGHRESQSATPPGVAPRSVRRHYLSFGIIHRPSATTREPCANRSIPLQGGANSRSCDLCEPRVTTPTTISLSSHAAQVTRLTAMARVTLSCGMPRSWLYPVASRT